jgi:hypothetical protein
MSSRMKPRGEPRRAHWPSIAMLLMDEPCRATRGEANGAVARSPFLTTEPAEDAGERRVFIADRDIAAHRVAGGRREEVAGLGRRREAIRELLAFGHNPLGEGAAGWLTIEIGRAKWMRKKTSAASAAIPSASQSGNGRRPTVYR